MTDDSRPRPRASHQLPPGRHGLSRRYVRDNQRERLLDAVADAVSLVGYQAMSVEDIIGAAGVSRRTFYDTFSGKEDAFLAALDAVGGELLQGARDACASASDLPGQVIAALRSVLGFISDDPRRADLCVVEVLAAGPLATERRNEAMRTLARWLHEHGSAVRGSTAAMPELTAEAVVGGAYEVIYARVLEGRAAELPELVPELAHAIILPYVGHDAARRATAGAVSSVTSAR